MWSLNLGKLLSFLFGGKVGEGGWKGSRGLGKEIMHAGYGISLVANMNCGICNVCI